MLNALNLSMVWYLSSQAGFWQLKHKQVLMTVLCVADKAGTLARNECYGRKSVVWIWARWMGLVSEQGTVINPSLARLSAPVQILIEFLGAVTFRVCPSLFTGSYVSKWQSPGLGPEDTVMTLWWLA